VRGTAAERAFERIFADARRGASERLRREAWQAFAERGSRRRTTKNWRFTSLAALEGLDFRRSATGSDSRRAARLRARASGAGASPRDRERAPCRGSVESLERALLAGRSRSETSSTRSCAVLGAEQRAAQRRAFIEIAAERAESLPIHCCTGSTPGPAGAESACSRRRARGRERDARRALHRCARHAQPLELGHGARGRARCAAELRAGQELPESAFHVSSLATHQGRAVGSSSPRSRSVGRLARVEISSTLSGEHAELDANACISAAVTTPGPPHHDRPRLAAHHQPRAVQGHPRRRRPHGVFHGRVHVRPDAQKIDASQTNRTLLLSDGAVIDSKPQLEIYADDVKCSHGASVGQLDPDQISTCARAARARAGARAADLRVRERAAREAPAPDPARVTRADPARLAAARRRAVSFDARRSRSSSRSWPARCTASRSCISTARPRVRSPRR